ncbi:hypothetical protein [Umezawaea sp. Da 62-37]|uniref:hypothetical protein n=1 Tax=Umezawaea sp. Da 62-37 TaxID=3075927 RepID=UPI0028F6E044|nr:hypothetical protein [Umezawaea sp. Da 62-37]WNV87759.1 hypothetical protein RM788_05580 [Umezawaea sp. Da 62-37]
MILAGLLLAPTGLGALLAAPLTDRYGAQLEVIADFLTHATTVSRPTTDDLGDFA